MNKQKNSKNQEAMDQAKNSIPTANNDISKAKKQASKGEYETLTAKEDANNDYE